MLVLLSYMYDIRTLWSRFAKSCCTEEQYNPAFPPHNHFSSFSCRSLTLSSSCLLLLQTSTTLHLLSLTLDFTGCQISSIGVVVTMVWEWKIVDHLSKLIRPCITIHAAFCVIADGKYGCPFFDRHSWQSLRVAAYFDVQIGLRPRQV